MPAEPTLEEGKRYRGSEAFKDVEGICVGLSETGFGLKFADIKTDDGEVRRCRSLYFTEVEEPAEAPKPKERAY